MNDKNAAAYFYHMLATTHVSAPSKFAQIVLKQQSRFPSMACFVDDPGLPDVLTISTKASWCERSRWM